MYISFVASPLMKYAFFASLEYSYSFQKFLNILYILPKEDLLLFFTRMRERELQRRAQEASGLQQNFFACKCYHFIHHFIHLSLQSGLILSSLCAQEASGLQPNFFAF